MKKLASLLTDNGLVPTYGFGFTWYRKIMMTSFEYVAYSWFLVSSVKKHYNAKLTNT